MIYACSITIEDIFLYDNVYNCVILLLRFDLNFVLMCVKSSYVYLKRFWFLFKSDNKHNGGSNNYS